MKQNCVNCSVKKCEYYGKNRLNGCRWYKNKNVPTCPHCGEEIEEYTVIEGEKTKIICDNCDKSFLLGVKFIFDYGKYMEELADGKRIDEV